MLRNKCIALLPMKAHSERLPNKNIRSFCGNPLYHSILTSLLKSEYIKEVVINTDIKSIAEEVTELFKNVRVIDRPKELCGDYISINSLIAYDMSQSEGEHFLQTHSTNPLLTTETINKAILKYFNNFEKFDSLFSVTRLQKRFYTPNGSPINHDPKDHLLRTQDLPSIYEENSCIYIFSRDSFKKANNHRIGLKPQMFEINLHESIDIDEESDFILAEALYKIKQNELKEETSK